MLKLSDLPAAELNKLIADFEKDLKNLPVREQRLIGVGVLSYKGYPIEEVQAEYNRRKAPASLEKLTEEVANIEVPINLKGLSEEDKKQLIASASEIGIRVKEAALAEFARSGDIAIMQASSPAVENLKEAMKEAAPRVFQPMRPFSISSEPVSSAVFERRSISISGETEIVDPEKVFNDPGREYGVAEAITAIEQIKAPLLLLRVPAGVPDSKANEYVEHLKEFWEEHRIKTPVLVMPDCLRMLGCITFDFSIAIKLLKLGYKLQRTGWDGYIYMDNSIIYHSNDCKEWKSTQKAILASNWRIYR